MTAFRQRLLQYTDNTFLRHPEQWSTFLGAMAEAHEQDMNMLREQSRVEIGQQRVSAMEIFERISKTVQRDSSARGLSLKDLKPDKFESNKKSKQTFKQWSDDLKEWTKWIDADYERLLKVTQEMQEWNEAAWKQELASNGIREDNIEDSDHQLLIILRRFTEGEAREVVDTVNSGGEAWYRLHDRFYPKTAIGATGIVNRLVEVKRPQNISESYQRLTEIRSLIQEFKRQSPLEPLPTAMIKSAYMRVVPENYKRGLEMQIDVDRCTAQTIEDKIMQFIRSNSTGPVSMDTSVLQSSETNARSQEVRYAAQPHYNANQYLNYFDEDGYHYDDEGNYQDQDVMLFNKGKGKGQGKGGFKGTCYNCGKYGHSQRYCYSKGSGAGGKGAGLKGKGAWQQKGGKGTAVQSMERVEEQEHDDRHGFALRFEPWSAPCRPARRVQQGGRQDANGFVDSNRYAALGDNEPGNKELSLFEMGELNNFDNQEWRPLPKPMVVDSGAGETVLPSSWLPEHCTEESVGSKNNNYYVTANGDKIYNEGKKDVNVSSLDGKQVRSLTFQVANVKKALGSVSQMVRKGNRVVFDRTATGEDLAFIENKTTKERMFMRVENGVYVLDVLVEPPKTKPFGRQA